MLRPSYTELMDIVNADAETDNMITSRYSIVIAAAKRARQIIDGAVFKAPGVNSDKAVSIAINEMLHGRVKIDPEGLSDNPDEWFGQMKHRSANRQSQMITNVALSADSVISSQDLAREMVYDDEIEDDGLFEDVAAADTGVGFAYRGDSFANTFEAEEDDGYDEYKYDEGIELNEDDYDYSGDEPK